MYVHSKCVYWGRGGGGRGESMYVQHMQTCDFSHMCTCPNPPASALVEFEGHSRSASKNKHHHALPWQHSFYGIWQESLSN